MLKHINYSPLKPLLDKADPLVVNVIAPELAAFKALQQMYRVKEDKSNIQKDLDEAGIP